MSVCMYISHTYIHTHHATYIHTHHAGLQALVDDLLAKGQRQTAMDYLSLQGCHGLVRGTGVSLMPVTDVSLMPVTGVSLMPVTGG